MEGLIIKNTGSWYLVRTDDGRNIECKVKGNFRLKDIKSTNPVTVGDRVSIDINAENTAFITELKDRKNYIIRKASNLSKQTHILATNLDQAYLIITVSKPVTSTVFIDRFLASAEAYRIPVTLVFNKIDAYDPDDLEYMEALIGLYQHIGYPCLKISALNMQDTENIRQTLTGKITLLSGHSGVGKSTLLNALIPGAKARTSSISDYHGKGMHTTTFSEMLELPGGGWIIDTPGIKGFGLIDMEPEEICHYFPDIFKFADKCRFNNCIHTNEPDCAVRDAVEQHYISESRYKSYLNMLESDTQEKYRK